MGPTGELLAPMGTMDLRRRQGRLCRAGRGLAAGGVDLLWVETMSDLEEARAAVEGARSVTDLPIAPR
jgi:methionine synthase I (cobalamin-dependent)